MASGRPDYWYGMLPGHSVSGVNQTDWLEEGYKDIAANDQVEIINYTVPADYILYITNGIVSGEGNSMSRVTISLSGPVSFSVWFNQVYNFPAILPGSFTVEAGDNFQVVIHNKDNVTVLYYAAFMGFLEYKIV